jgi:Fic family protein
MMERVDQSVALMEPMLPEERNRLLEDLAVDLIAKASALAGQVHPIVRESIGDLVRSINCYYSNLIEGHNTHPRDIDRALADDFSTNLEKRNLQLEAKAHIEVQRMIDAGQGPRDIVSIDYILWLHREFCRRLPTELLSVENPDTKAQLILTPGQLRTGGVKVGRHIPPHSSVLLRFLQRFEEAYSPQRLSKLQQLIAVAAAHHRLLWVHPFYDGNGRVTRLFSHAYLRHIGIGNSLWSVSRGLARRNQDYKAFLMTADQKRWNDLDGRGNLTAKGLVRFCEFFLEVAIDQVEYMASLLDTTRLSSRIERYVEEEIRLKHLPRGSFLLLREALFSGEIERGKAASITGYQGRQARSVLNELVKKGLLISNTQKGPVRLGFPLEVVESWFPKLYPMDSDAPN